MPALSGPRDSLFGPRRGRRRGAGGVAGPLALAAGAALAAWLIRRPASFYLDLYEARRDIDRREFQKAQDALERAWRLRPEHPLVLDGAGQLFVQQQPPGWKAK